VTMQRAARMLARTTIKMSFTQAIKQIVKGALIEMLQANFPNGMASEFFDLLKEGHEGVITSKGSCGCVAKVEHKPSETAWTLTINYANCYGYKKNREKKEKCH